MNNSELIELYLQNKLSEKDKIAFEANLKNNKILQEQVLAQKQILETITKMGLREEIKSEVKKIKTQQKIKWASIIIAGIAALSAIVWISANAFNKKQDAENHTKLYEVNEQGNNNWSDADIKLPSTLFKINNLHDTIIESPNGIIFQIPANAFKTNNKSDVVLEVKEALNPFDIVKAGLTTLSNNELLQTGGMFYLNARNGNTTLEIDSANPITVMMPSTSTINMSLFDGERKPNGEINWVKPKPMLRRLSTTEITKLNFYPPHFIDTISKLGFNIKNKKVVDSIFYSYININNCDSEDFANSDSVARKEDTSKIAISENRIFVTHLTASSTSTLLSSGKILFEKNCSTCHSLEKEVMLTGPSMYNVFNRVPNKNWFKQFTINNEKMIKSGDKYANDIYKKYNKAAMTVFEGQLTDRDLEAIANYLQEFKDVKITDETQSCIQEINPSRIKAIWDKKFNNTILASKAFEKRLQVIYKTCNPKLLNLYINNLNKPLCELDSVAATLCSGQEKNEFINFANEKLGGVKIDTERSFALQNYVTGKRKLYDSLNKSVLEKMYQNEYKQTMDFLAASNKLSSEIIIKQVGVIEEEREKNLTEAYRQLGKGFKSNTTNAGDFFVSTITSPGWKNVDAYVAESTYNRTTLNYTDPQSNKKAIIEYKPISIEVINEKNYEDIKVYLVPNKLSSFQKVNKNKTIFSEKLNTTFSYNLLCYATKGNQNFYYLATAVQPSTYKIKLKHITETDLKNMVNAKFNFNSTAELIKELDLQFLIKKDVVRQQKINNRDYLRNRIFKTVYPCGNFLQQQMPTNQMPK